MFPNIHVHLIQEGDHGMWEIVPSKRTVSVVSEAVKAGTSITVSDLHTMKSAVAHMESGHKGEGSKRQKLRNGTINIAEGREMVKELIKLINKGSEDEILDI